MVLHWLNHLRSCACIASRGHSSASGGCCEPTCAATLRVPDWVPLVALVAVLWGIDVLLILVFGERAMAVASGVLAATGLIARCCRVHVRHCRAATALWRVSITRLVDSSGCFELCRSDSRSGQTSIVGASGWSSNIGARV